MSTVVLRPDDGQPDSMKALIAAVGKHLGDEPLLLGSGGVVVSRAVAKKYLNAKPPADADTTGRTVDNTRNPLITRHGDPAADGPAVVDGLTVGGRTPEGDFPGGYPGTTLDSDGSTPAEAAAPDSSGGNSGAAPTPAPARKATPAKKTTAAAQQRSARTATRS